MVARVLRAQHAAARSRYDDALSELERVTIQVAIVTLADVLPGAASVVAFGDVDEDWIPRLRTQRVMAADGAVLFDANVGHPERAVEDAVDYIDIECLEVLIDLRPEAYSGDVEVGR